MTYEQAITSFWKVSAEKDLDCKSIAMMLALLHIRQERGFASRCSVPNEWLEELLHIDIRTIRTARKKLIDCGLIQYVEGKAKRQPEYIFEVSDEPQEIPIAQEWMDEPQEVVLAPVKVDKEQPKKRTKKQEGGLFTEKALEQPKKMKQETPPPTMDDVADLFRKRGLSHEDAERFYYYYDAQGWVTSSGQKIKRLDSMVNRWLTNNHKKNENDKGDSSIARAQDAANIIARLAAKE